MRRAIRIVLTGIAGLAGLACGVAIVPALAVLVLPLPALAPPVPKPWDITVTVTEAFLARELNAHQGTRPRRSRARRSASRSTAPSR